MCVCGGGSLSSAEFPVSIFVIIVRFANEQRRRYLYSCLFFATTDDTITVIEAPGRG